ARPRIPGGRRRSRGRARRDRGSAVAFGQTLEWCDGLGGVDRGTAVHRLLVLVERGEVAGQEVLRLQLDLTDALAADAPALAELLEGARLVLGEALLDDVPAQVADSLLHLGQGLLNVGVLLLAEERLLRAGARLLQAVDER